MAGEIVNKTQSPEFIIESLNSVVESYRADRVGRLDHQQAVSIPVGAINPVDILVNDGLGCVLLFLLKGVKAT